MNHSPKIRFENSSTQLTIIQLPGCGVKRFPQFRGDFSTCQTTVTVFLARTACLRAQLENSPSCDFENRMLFEARSNRPGPSKRRCNPSGLRFDLSSPCFVFSTPSRRRNGPNCRLCHKTVGIDGCNLLPHQILGDCIGTGRRQRSEVCVNALQVLPTSWLRDELDLRRAPA